MSMMALLAAGCSSDEITVKDGGENGGNDFNGTAFVSMNITLPTAVGGPNYANTRAVTDEGFEEGKADEYAVSTVTVSYYSDAAGANQIGESKTYSTGQFSVSAGSDDITRKILLPVETVTFGSAYALVEVNKPQATDMNVVSGVATPTSVATVTGNGKSFYMTNAVQKDGSHLVQVTAYETESQARDHAAEQNIYVERAVAKVTLTTSATDHKFTIDGAGVYGGAEVQFTNWALDLTNTKMYPVRKFKGTGTYDAIDFARFYHTRAYRTFWAEDPNYSAAAGSDLTKIATTDVTKAIGTYDYCLENTFNTAWQKQSQTTRVVVKATYKPKDFPSIQTWYLIGNTAYPKSTIAGTPEIKGLQETIKDILGVTSVEMTETAGKKVTFTTSSFTMNGTGTAPSDEQVKAVTAVLGSTYTTYKDGVCYYAIRIKHLDNECPWGSEVETEGFAKDAPAYGGSKYVDYTNPDPAKDDNYTTENMEKEYLGRYGVVRNNVYKIKITKVSQPGDPVMPGTPDTPDDEHNYYLQSTINMLDWAVRSQEAEL